METAKGVNTCTVGNDKLDCFNELTEDQLKRITDNLLEVTYKKGENICKQGSFASHVMVLKTGLAKIYMEGCNEQLTLKILPAVNIIGLPFVFEGNSIFHYSAMAYLESKVQLLEMQTFRTILKENSKFAAKIINLLGENTVLAYGRFFCLTKKQTFGRFADILLCLSQRVYKQNNFPLQLNRKELAELASMSVETTTRILTKFKSDGLIKVNCDSIEILDLERLTTISNNG